MSRSVKPLSSKSAAPARQKAGQAGQSIGILGGGQLARMLVLKAHDLGLTPHVYSENPHDPAAKVTCHWHQGTLDDQKRLKKFLQVCPIVTFESEFVDTLKLARLAKTAGCKLSPKPEVMAQIQDRVTQKKLLDRYRIPTAPWMPVANTADAESAFARFSGKVVFKKRLFGYDGYGTFIVKNPSDLKAFAKHLKGDRTGFIAEALIPFQRELAVTFARGRDREIVELPTVETKQENSRCLWVKGPIKPTGAAARKGLRKMLADTGYVGVMAAELFETRSGEILVNELAPRVHNSAHYSLEGLTCDQFSMHLRAVLGLSLGSAALLAPGFAMYNLLGTDLRQPAWQPPREAFLHWYGKGENRAGRKMGHLTALDSSPEKAWRKVARARSLFDL